MLELLEEKGKSKDWLREELKRLDASLVIPPTANRLEMLKACSAQTIQKLCELMKKDDLMIDEPSDPTETLHWFFTDIIASSDPEMSTMSQIRKIAILHKLIRNTGVFKQAMNNFTALPTGDGVVIGFHDSPETPLKLAIQLHELLHKYNEVRPDDQTSIRIGIDSGPVYFIKDVFGNDTVWGPGIILAKRLMDKCGPNQIFVSGKTGDDLSKLKSSYKEMMHPIGEYVTKHGVTVPIYNVYGVGFGNETVTKDGKVNDEYKYLKMPKFEFNEIEIQLEITNLENMDAHHTWIWNVKNISKDPLKEIHYYVIGDRERRFEDLQISITDENNNKLEPTRIQDKPTEKQFDAVFVKPLEMNQSTKLTMQYDWEEPFKSFDYVISAKCRKLKILFTMPKGKELGNLRLYDVDPHTNLKIYAEPSPKFEHLSDKSILRWESEDTHTIVKGDCYRIAW